MKQKNTNLMIIILSFTLIHFTMNSKEKTYINSKLKKSSELDSLKIKEMTKVEVTAEESSKFEEKTLSHFTTSYFKKLFSLSSPINKCLKENCEYCCLSLNFCGSKQQCENSQKTMQFLRCVFLSISIVLLTFLIYKIWITDPESEHTESDKIQEGALTLLIGMFIYNRDNRRKFKNQVIR